MSVPLAMLAQVSALDAAISAASPLTSAPFDTLNALAFQAGVLASAIEVSIDANAGALDTFTAPLMPADMIGGVLALADAADTQTALSDLEGYVARIEINLENR